MDKLNSNIMLKVFTNGSFEKRFCKCIFLITNDYEYSIFENHSNISIPLNGATITIKTEPFQDEYFEISSGIFLFQNNVARVISME
jgi:hypothetical protein